MSGGGGGGPCGACKFLRRKCVVGCVFAPYFDAEEGTTHFAAVHKVFGASNAAKLLIGIPENMRLHAVLSLCYEALSRVRDPVFGCVSQILALHHQVVNLQAELACVKARLSVVEGLPPPPPRQIGNHSPAAEASGNDDMSPYSLSQLQCIFHPQQEEGSELHVLAHDFVSKYFSGVKFPSDTHSPNVMY